LLDVLVQNRRNKTTALKLLRNQGIHPRTITTDKLASYRAALRNSVWTSAAGLRACEPTIGLRTAIEIVADPGDLRLPAGARTSLRMLVAQLAVVKAQILENDRRIMADARSTELGRRLMAVPGVGPLLASALVATVADPRSFRSGRDLAAWIGLVPRQNSSGGKERLGSISKAGHRYLRQMLVVGSMAVIRHARRSPKQRPWLTQLLARRKVKVAAVALANKIARTVWAMMITGDRYREPVAA
jgi:transposase